jgi:hypothetical protein
LIAQKLSTTTRSISSHIDSSAEFSGALAAIFSNTRRSPGALALGDIGDAGANQPPIGAR